MGDDQPSPGIAVFQRIFEAALHWAGTPFSCEIPCRPGPRKQGQSSLCPMPVKRTEIRSDCAHHAFFQALMDRRPPVKYAEIRTCIRVDREGACGCRPKVDEHTRFSEECTLFAVVLENSTGLVTILSGCVGDMTNYLEIPTV
jgi:hypothetical protein